MNKFLLFFLVTAFTCGAHATPMTYSYTSGDLLPSGTAGVPAVTFISLTFTADLAADLMFSDQTANISDWAISDGITTVNSASLGALVLLFSASTDAGALIDEFIFAVQAPVLQALSLGDLGVMFLTDSRVMDGSRAGSGYCALAADDGCAELASVSSSIVNGGVVSSVPLAPTLALFGLGLAGLGLIRRKRITQG